MVIKKGNSLVTSGIYAYSRHPQYLGFIMILYGWLMGWPTIITVVFSSILIFMYVRVCILEEREVLKLIPEYQEYKKRVPFFI